jgi:hypothetical protein
VPPVGAWAVWHATAPPSAKASNAVPQQRDWKPKTED